MGSRVVVLATGLFWLLTAALAHAGWSVSAGQPRVEETDLSLPVLGGRVEWGRTFLNGAWYLNSRYLPVYASPEARARLDEHTPHRTSSSGDASLPLLAGRAEQIRTQEGKVFTYAGAPEAPRYPARYLNAEGSEAITATAEGYRWDHYLTGDWIRYDSSSRVSAFGNRSGVLATVVTTSDSAQQGELRDRRDALILRWTQDTATGVVTVTDRAGRSVRYEDQFRTVVDVNGQRWGYRYEAKVAPPPPPLSGGSGGGGSGGIAPPPEYAPPPHANPGLGLALTPEAMGNRLLVQALTPQDEGLYQFSYTSNTVTQVADGLGVLARYEFDRKPAYGSFYTKHLDADGLMTEEWFDSHGKLIRQARNGVLQQLTTISDDRRSEVRTDAAGHETRTEYNEWHQLVRTVFPDGSQTTTTYDPVTHLPTVSTDELGVETRYGYNAQGLLTRLTEAAGRPEQRVTEYDYDADGLRTTVRQLGDAVTATAETTYGFDAHGNVTLLRDPEGAETQLTYDAAGNVLRREDALHHVTTATYRADGQKLTETDALQRTTTYEYDAFGRLTSQTHPGNRQDTWTYDLRGRLTAHEDALHQRTSYQYTAGGKLTQLTDPSGIGQKKEYDEEGRLKALVDGVGNRTEMQYGEDGRVSTVRLPTGAEQRFTYDSRGRVSTQTLINGTETLTTQFRYDAKGRRLEQTDPAGRSQRQAYDALGRQTESADIGNSTTRLVYDARDNLLRLTDANSNAHRFAYDKRNQQTQENRPGGEIQTFGYDALGRLDTTTDPKGNVRRYRYTALGRLLQETIKDVQGSVSYDVSYTYDPDTNAFTGYTDALQGIGGDYVYDATGRKTQETTRYGSLSFTRRLAYEPNGQLRSDQHPDGTLISYGYNTAGQLASVQLPGEGQLEISAYTWSQPQTLRYPGSLVRTQTVDALQRPEQIVLKNSLGQPLLSLGYLYDAAGNITQKRIVSPTQNQTLMYGYDDQDHLIKAQSELRNETFTYDKLGNRLADNQHSDYRYNANNQLLSGQQKSFAYDAAGSLTQETDTADGAQSRTLGYDARNRLTEVRDHQNQLVATYAYDPFGRRYRKTLYRTAVGPLASPQTTYFVYGEEGLIGEVDANGVQQVAYGHVPQTAYGTAPLFQRRNNTYAYYQLDHLGTPQQLVAKDGSIVWEGSYVAFGEVTINYSAPWVNNLRFPGQYYDTETGLHQNYFRDYSNKTGRYIESDPIGLRGGVNLYLYTYARPNVNMDPRGLETFSCKASDATGGGRGESMVNGRLRKICTYRCTGSCTGIVTVISSSSIEVNGSNYCRGAQLRTTVTPSGQMTEDLDYYDSFDIDTSGAWGAWDSWGGTSDIYEKLKRLSKERNGKCCRNGVCCE